MRRKLTPDWNYVMWFGAGLGIAGAITSWISVETAINPGLIMIIGMLLFYVSNVSKQIENLREEIKQSL